ncbi:hypothetical protein MLD52_21955 [Puniceicoccaceae bacterium K14]|nr:hypothetical protein [Puniceicoccaceae bacterium K14]
MLKKIPTIVALIILSTICSSTSYSEISLEDVYRDTIINDVTLNVPSEYATVQDALSFLDDKRIATGFTVSIQIANGTYSNYESIYVSHNDGNRINIIGNTSSPSSVIIEFDSNKIGVHCDYSKVLGLINGITLKSDGTGTGILANRCSMIGVGSAVTIENFNIGLNAAWGSTILANGITVKSNGTHGVLAHSAQISLSGVTIQSNGNGVYANANSNIQFENGSCSSNTYGVRSHRNSYVDTTGTTYSGNTTDTDAAYSGAIGD